MAISEVEWLDIFGDNLRDMMKEWGHTQESLSDATGLSQATISRYLHKKQVPSCKALINLSYEFECSVDELINYDDRID